MSIVKSKKKCAVILGNLGGPDSVTAIKPFLYNLFNDRAVIDLPRPFRSLLARFIAVKRLRTAIGIYAHLNYCSPILQETRQQALMLQQELNGHALSEEYDFHSFVMMRYWHPFCHEVMVDLAKYNPDRVVLLPLYPQYSMTTTGSMINEWHKQSRLLGSKYKANIVGCFALHDRFIEVHASLIGAVYEDLSRKPKVIFSAHGLPLSVIAKGDPYAWFVQEGVRAIVGKVGIRDADWSIAYQSKVGRAEWLGPLTETVLKVHAANKEDVLVVPLSFISEHSETLVELDIEYRELFKLHGGGAYIRIPTLGIHKDFITLLCELCAEALIVDKPAISSAGSLRLCPQGFKCGCIS